MLAIKLLILVLITFISLFSSASEDQTQGLIQSKLDYEVDYQELEKGNFQYYYSLLKQSQINDELKFENLTKDQSQNQAKLIIETFLPLDTKKLWNPKDNNYLAVAKFNYILPLNINVIDEDKFLSTEYLQSTLPRYKVTKHKDYFHVGGSLITPDFDVFVNFLKAEDPINKLVKGINPEKIKSGEMKVSFMHQENFGRVMFFRTAKMASALIIYEKLDSTQTLVTQYILSNVINVPAKSLIRKGMIENLQNVVIGSREAVKNF